MKCMASMMGLSVLVNSLQAVKFSKYTSNGPEEMDLSLLEDTLSL